LIQHKADPFLLGINNSNVLHICAERNFTEIAKMIVEDNKEKNKELVYGQTTIEEDEDETGMTPLHVACEWNSMELVEYYFSLGGEKLVRIKNAGGEDAIAFAYAENMEEAYSFLCT
jgi:ankyrin repeat protein